MASLQARINALTDSIATKLNFLNANKLDKTGSLPASQITGVMNAAQIPVIDFFKPFVSTSATIAGLSTADQANISTDGRNGTFNAVTLTDGSTWIYVSGSKTAAASYIMISDTTPDFSMIANRPTTVAGYGITDAVDVNNYDPGDLSARLNGALTF